MVRQEYAVQQQESQHPKCPTTSRPWCGISLPSCLPSE
jgi:hypothetical protein